MENGGNGKDDAECRGSIRYYFKYRSRQGLSHIHFDLINI